MSIVQCQSPAPVRMHPGTGRFRPGLGKGGLLLAAVLLFGGCASGEPQNLAGTAVPESTQPTTAGSSPAVVGTTMPETVWVDFEAFGIGFSHPEQWKVLPGECVGCVGKETSKENKFGQWNVVGADGTVLAHFAPYSANDTDGNTNTYKRTYLGSQPLTAMLDAPASFVFEHAHVTPGPNADGTEPASTARLMVIDDALVDAKDTAALAPHFNALEESGTEFFTADGFAAGADPKAPTLEQAKAFMADPDYALMKQTMLGVHLTIAK